MRMLITIDSGKIPVSAYTIHVLVVLLTGNILYKQIVDIVLQH